MSSNIGVLLPRKKISLKYLSGKIIAIDALNALYQFLSIIRLPTGIPLTDRKGRITSHLTGLLYRTISLLEESILPVYVFDGKPPKFKHKEIMERMKIKEKFKIEWIQALREGDMVKAFKKSVMTAHLTTEMIEESKELLNLMGIPWIQAPSEGEAQAAYMAIKRDVYAAASQDYDSILFGAPILIRNLGIESRLYYPKRGIFKKLNPEIIELQEVLNKLKINRKQLIDIALLIGTDYNEGIKGIGPKKALKLIRIYGSIERVLKILKVQVDYDIEELRNFFLNPPVTNNYKIEILKPKINELKEFLLSRDFNPHRVNKALNRLEIAHKSTINIIKTQKEISQWLIRNDN